MTDYIQRSSYNAPTSTRVAVLAGTALSSGLCVAGMMKHQHVKKLPELEMGIKEGIALCTSSTLGGLTTGLVVDKKENHKYKLKDSVNQLVGNTFIPFGSLAICNKFNKNLRVIPRTLSAIATLVVTTFLGHGVANMLNKKIFGENSGYKCNIKDFITDADDIVFSASTVLRNKGLYKLTATLCPFTYLTQGFLTGTRQADKQVEPHIDKIA